MKGPPAGRRTWLRIMMLLLGANIFLLLSPRVALWWDKETQPDNPSPPAVLRWFFRVRPNTGEADVHVVLWFVAAFAAALTVRSWRSRRLVLLAVWLFSAAIEVVQSFTPHRTAQWGDLLGNAIGVCLAGGAVWLLTRRREPSVAGPTPLESSLSVALDIQGE